jgi:hypothetical protein
MTTTRSRTRPVEIWKDRDAAHRWHWRCNYCGLLHGGQRTTQPQALIAALNHLSRVGFSREVAA